MGIRLTRKTVYWRLGVVVAVMIGVRTAVFLVPSTVMKGVTLMLPDYRFILYWYDGAIGLIIGPERYSGFFSISTWSGFSGLSPIKNEDFSIGFPVELLMLTFFLVFLAFFRIWQLLFHPKRDELIAE